MPDGYLLLERSDRDNRGRMLQDALAVVLPRHSHRAERGHATETASTSRAAETARYVCSWGCFGFRGTLHGVKRHCSIHVDDATL